MDEGLKPPSEGTFAGHPAGTSRSNATGRRHDPRTTCASRTVATRPPRLDPETRPVRSRRPVVLAVAAAVLALGAALPASAQSSRRSGAPLAPLQGEGRERVATFDPAAGGTNVFWSISGRGDYLVKRSLEGGGDVGVADAALSVGARVILDRDWRMNIGLDYRITNYDWSGTTALGDDPWDNVFELGIAALFEHDVTDQWTLFGGPVLELSWEEGADVDKSLTGGALLGATYEVDEGLQLGLGLGIFSEIEDDTTFFPLITVDWRITDDLTLTTRTETGGAGLELTGPITEDFSWGVGFRYDRRRFRLNDEGPQPEGVGEFESFPVYVRGRWQASPQLQLDAFLGTSVDGNLDIENEDGQFIDRASYPYALVFGARLTYRF